MAVNVIKQRSKPSVNAVGLVVEASGLEITVRAGEFVISGNRYSLEEDEVATITPHPDLDTWVRGYLVTQVSDGSTHVLVDEVVKDEEPFWFSDDDVKFLHLLFWGVLPVGASSVDDVDITVVHIVEAEARVSSAGAEESVEATEEPVVVEESEKMPLRHRGGI